MKDSRLLGVIKNISVGSRQGDVFVFARALVIVRGDAAAMWVRAVGMQFGALGGLLSGLWLKKEEEKRLRMRSGLSPEQLAALVDCTGRKVRRPKARQPGVPDRRCPGRGGGTRSAAEAA